ncbi:molybdopterin-binding protein [Luteimonas cucumeris]|nr:molybdopterin-binding protein [Luteimonas cucumeris]
MTRSWPPALLALALSACTSSGAVKPPPSATATPPAPRTTHDPRLRAAAPSVLASPRVVPLDAATRAALPREVVTASAHGPGLSCEGVPLSALLRAAGALPVDMLGATQLAQYVLVQARDGHRVLYSLAELDPDFGQRRVLLVDRCNGRPLENEDGPLQLIALDDARPARWVRQVESITVVAAP